jgi:hypothetical protein
VERLETPFVFLHHFFRSFSCSASLTSPFFAGFFIIPPSLYLNENFLICNLFTKPPQCFFERLTSSYQHFDHLILQIHLLVSASPAALEDPFGVNPDSSLFTAHHEASPAFLTHFTDPARWRASSLPKISSSDIRSTGGSSSPSSYQICVRFRHSCMERIRTIIWSISSK